MVSRSWTPLPKDPTRPITSFKTAWTKIREKAGVKGRWHDNRHTLVTELAESGAGDEVIIGFSLSLSELSQVYTRRPAVKPFKNCFSSGGSFRVR